MGSVIDIRNWRHRRPTGQDEGAVSGIARLERAVHRLDELAPRAALHDAEAVAKLEVDVLAIIDELTLGHVDAACERAERLAHRLASA